MKLSNDTLRFSQLFFHPIANLLIKIFVKYNLKFNFKPEKNKFYIFTPNHLSYLDPPLIFFSIPFRIALRIPPLRFMTAKRFLKNPISNFFLGLFGCYPADEDSLKTSMNFLYSKNNLCIFIQGKIDKSNQEKAKVGAVYLKNKFPEAQIIPVKITLNKKLNFKNFFFRKIKLNIIFDKPYKIDRSQKDFQIITNSLLKRINSLT